YQVGCIYALTSKTHPEDKPEAFRLLFASLRTGFGLDMVDTDTDLDPLRSDPEFKRLVGSARAFHAPSKRADSVGRPRPSPPGLRPPPTRCLPKTCHREQT